MSDYRLPYQYPLRKALFTYGERFYFIIVIGIAEFVFLFVLLLFTYISELLTLIGLFVGGLTHLLILIGALTENSRNSEKSSVKRPAYTPPPPSPIQYEHVTPKVYKAPELLQSTPAYDQLLEDVRRKRLEKGRRDLLADPKDRKN
ncbi:MAG TPA: hypothetical protein VGN95_19255 [Pyrinomonadaceae bacterium]|jgi:hypothetical protein|nr:hypothetical protein [Pyrinomonadaceae bacterium]